MGQETRLRETIAGEVIGGNSKLPRAEDAQRWQFVVRYSQIRHKPDTFGSDRQLKK